MPNMLATLDTSHFEMSALNDDAPGTQDLSNNWLMSATAETSQDPIGPCGPLEQSVDSCRHLIIAAWSFSLDSGVHPVVEYYYSGHTAGVRLRARVRVTVGSVSGLESRSALGRKSMCALAAVSSYNDI